MILFNKALPFFLRRYPNWLLLAVMSGADTRAAGISDAENIRNYSIHILNVADGRISLVTCHLT